ncbi:hypothetical protein DPMN_044058 [Dreissena polymorpha]|uniref:Uncharacterized protein n=1 Tax=Dreissena polymorpha TaxID=45954 RepID=A0A9D4D3T3_DREPO|nr:hypothetical protein DPMN_044058 [Dreissena polymorpha]
MECLSVEKYSATGPLCCVRICDRFNRCRWYRVPPVSPTYTYLRQRRQLTAHTTLDDLQSKLFLTLYFLPLGSVM